MIENIVRNIEDGATPMAAAIKGAGEIGFTILSISISLIAVFIPLFLISGVLGLLFRGFAITVAVSVVVSLVVSLTLTPMMCARLLTPQGSGKPGRVSQAVEHLFDRLVGVYDRALVVALHHHRSTGRLSNSTVAASNAVHRQAVEMLIRLASDHRLAGFRWAVIG
jgi:HAE1 family hydrophobic/amphiphilic exporter-1